jgi:hypothetical protein
LSAIDKADALLWRMEFAPDDRAELADRAVRSRTCKSIRWIVQNSVQRK